ncbi:nuclear transport factor 2 family protein [Chamaesiphon sp.]|uniref:nuclear transport factor 2 family protein n=1 Tax=Chamaesiphon sp. TaxID=2814140 RepID=UPI003593B918
MKTITVLAQPEFRTIDLDTSLDIDGIYENTIYQYFIRLNNGEFMETAQLFAEQGCLNPPFENSIAGREAIARYLEKEAKGMNFCPERGETLTKVGLVAPLKNSDRTQYQIQGKVKTNFFTVNVSWSIELNAAKEIMAVDVKLLASINELLSFRS